MHVKFKRPSETSLFRISEAPYGLILRTIYRDTKQSLPRDKNVGPFMIIYDDNENDSNRAILDLSNPRNVWFCRELGYYDRDVIAYGLEFDDI